MNRRLDISITVALMILAFTVTLAVLRSQREPPSPALQTATAPTSWWRAVLPAHSRPPVTVPVTAALPPSSAPAHAADDSPPPIEVPPADYNGPPLPVLLAVSSSPGQREVDDNGIATGELVVVRSVNVVNTSSDLLNITVMAVDTPTQETTLAQVLVPPNGQAHVSTESSGLKLEPGYTVTLRSRGYQEMATTVQ